MTIFLNLFRQTLGFDAHCLIFPKVHWLRLWVVVTLIDTSITLYALHVHYLLQ